MEIVKEISAEIIKIGAHLGAFVVPAVILCAIGLILLAKYSYKLFKIVIPIVGIILGSILGVVLLGPVFEKIPGIYGIINPYYLAAFLCAAVLAVFCFKFKKFTVLLIGASAGYLVLGRIIKDVLLGIPFIWQLAETTERAITLPVGILICVLCMIVTALLVKKFFRGLYIIVSTIGFAAAGLGLAAIFIFQGTSIAEYATLGGLGLGAIIGLVFCAQQFGEIDYEY